MPRKRPVDLVVRREMVDEITTVSKKKLDEHVARLSDEDMVRANRAVVVFLGLAGPALKDTSA